MLSWVLCVEGWQTRRADDGVCASPRAWKLSGRTAASGITDGLAVPRAVRPDVCVLFLTARDMVEDRIAGITVGDGCVSKPFSPGGDRRSGA